ncbi:MAG: hypothetical protein Q4G22_03420 [Paracoccus sp. (in: a-proteobacteria)]|uniref:hypothetical protein n=1 Tax=Paracoccus sp. TaxID=267 RepID=UPI0026E0BB60|nr:hypothetical protein [Paracoccus sp. (in: a-proteobacteria)]MDO5630867.1 hypothetical protein [Paracoccus sp. (in: a-proteobacteria)]
MNRASIIFTVLAVGLFVIGGLVFAATYPPEVAFTGRASSAVAYQSANALVLNYWAVAPGGDHVNLALKMFSPGPPALWLLLIMIWAGLALHALRMAHDRWWYERYAKGRQAKPLARGFAGPPTPPQIAAQHHNDHTPTELAPLAGALIAGAIWPWIGPDRPWIGVGLAVVMLISALGAVVRGQRIGSEVRQSRAVGLFAGWVTVLAYAAIAWFVSSQMAVSAEMAGLMAMLLCAGTGATVQVMIGDSSFYSVGVIWALIGIAVATMTGAPTVAIGAVLGVASQTAVLVRAIT